MVLKGGFFARLLFGQFADGVLADLLHSLWRNPQARFQTASTLPKVLRAASAICLPLGR